MTTETRYDRHQVRRDLATLAGGGVDLMRALEICVAAKARQLADRHPQASPEQVRKRARQIVLAHWVVAIYDDPDEAWRALVNTREFD